MDAESPTVAFLSALWLEEPMPGSLVVWTKARRGETKRSTWCTTLAEAESVAAASRQNHDVYFGLALQDRDAALATARREKSTARLSHVRGFSATATAIPGLWMDIDIQAPAHRQTSLPPDLPAALSVLEAVPYEPTLIVDSGFGIHVYWLFREPWVFESETDRQAASDLVARLQTAIRVEAARRSWNLDGTSDLARVLRLPGTFNHKEDPPKEVKIAHLTPERRYNPADFAESLPKLPGGEADAPDPQAHGKKPPADLEAIVAECSWLRHCRDDAAILSEPEWYAMLGIVGRCASSVADGRQLAHQWSEAFPNYTRAETDGKLDHALSAAGPRTCNSIGSELGGHGTGCGTCRHRGKIKSPIVLGRAPWARRATASKEPSATEATSSTEEREGAIRALWALGDDPTPEEVQSALDRIARCLDGAEPLAVQTAREVAVRALKRKVSAPARFVEAALGGVRKAPNTASFAQRRPGAGPPYRATEQGLAWLKPTREGEVPILLTNFTAQIVGEVARDNGAEIVRSFEIEARHLGRDHRFEVAAAKFPMLGWVTEHLGALAVVNAGMGTRDHARAAVQLLSNRVESRTIFTHLGWRQIGDQWCFLHAGGAIGTLGTVPGIEIDPPSQLRLYLLPDPGPAVGLRSCFRATLGILDLLPDEVTVPILCAIWRSVLGPCDFSLHLAGQTGEGKTELSALAQQHFGAELDARHLPGSWSSTGNALEALAFAAKDALLVVDDFAPAGNAYDIQRQNQEAARLFRAQGNCSGRGRLRSDGELRPVMSPRGLILSTGEDVPTAHSIRARLLVLEVPAGAMAWDALTECQAAGRDGQFAHAMAAFLQWLAGHYERLRDLRPRRTAALREQAAASGSGHRRTPSIVAELAHGLEVFLVFAREVEALSETEAQDLWQRSWKALGQASVAQADHLATADPVRRFCELLVSSITTGRAHVAADDGTEPTNPAAWGWREEGRRTSAKPQGMWLPLGDRVGWLCDGALYLDPDSAYRAAQAMATVDGIAVTPRTLWKRAKERGLLVSSDESRSRNTVRATLQGSRRDVLHLDPGALLLEKPSQSAQPSQKVVGSPSSGTVLWDGSELGLEKLSQRTVPPAPDGPGSENLNGPIGTVGTVFLGQPSAQVTNWREV